MCAIQSLKNTKDIFKICLKEIYNTIQLLLINVIRIIYNESQKQNLIILQFAKKNQTDFEKISFILKMSSCFRLNSLLIFGFLFEVQSKMHVRNIFGTEPLFYLRIQIDLLNRSFV